MKFGYLAFVMVFSGLQLACVLVAVNHRGCLVDVHNGDGDGRASAAAVAAAAAATDIGGSRGRGGAEVGAEAETGAVVIGGGGGGGGGRAAPMAPSALESKSVRLVEGRNGSGERDAHFLQTTGAGAAQGLPLVLPPGNEHKDKHKLEVAELPEVSEQNLIVGVLMNKLRRSAAEVKRLVLERKAGLTQGGRVSSSIESTTPSASAFERRGCPRDFVAATYNIWNVNAEWQLRREAVASELRALKASVVGLQEVRVVNGGRTQGHELHDALSDVLPHLAYHAMWVDGGGAEEGLALLSQFPIHSTQWIELPVPRPPRRPNGPDPPSRGALLATLHVSNVPAFTRAGITRVTVAVTHLPMDDYAQCSVAANLAMSLMSLDVGETGPLIVLGDMNTYFDFEWPIDLLTQPITSFTTNTMWNPCANEAKALTRLQPQPHSSLVPLFYDVWDLVYSPAVTVVSRLIDLEEQSTMTNPRWWSASEPASGPTFPSHYNSPSLSGDSARIDRILLTSSLESLSLLPCDAGLFGTTAYKGEGYEQAFPSDHRGVAVVFVVAQSRPLDHAHYGDLVKEAQEVWREPVPGHQPV